MPHTEGPWTVETKSEEGRCEIVVTGLPDDEEMFVAIFPAKDAPTLAQATAMYELLKELEWSVEVTEYSSFCDEPPCPDGTYDTCPECGERKEDGHSSDCRLAAVLKAVEGGE